MGKGLADGFDGVVLTNQKVIKDVKGDLFHVLKASDECFATFGEAYFTSVNRNEVKGWKKHLRMRLNLVVPVGEVSFFIRNDSSDKYIEVRLGPKSYSRLTIPEGYWVAFMGRDEGLNLILNIASIEHDPTESVNASLDSFPINLIE